jgi:YVTN family beta-propeller protein
VGANPVAVAVDPGGAEAYADNYYAATVSIIDTAASTSSATGSVTGSIPVGDGPLGIAVSSDGAYAYVANNDDDTVTVIDTGVSVAGDSATAGLTASAQQFAVPDGTAADQCPGLAPASIDWPALASVRDQGWHVSWAQWPNAGAGGAVCTRQPYVTGQTWHVRTRS